MAIQVRGLTYDDLLQLREARDEQLELIDGELFVNPAPAPLHQLVSKRLSHILAQAVDNSGFGQYLYAPLDLKLADGTIVQPDLVVVRSARLAMITGRAIEGTPDFVIEIVSPSNDAYDRETKHKAYARHGVPEYWLVDPDAREVTIWSDPFDGRYRSELVTTEAATAVTIPNLNVVLAPLFAPFAKPD